MAKALTAADSPPLNMVDRQTNNLGILVLPKPGEVKIDGDLSDWDWSGRICCFADERIRNKYSTETAAMYDADNLYLAIKWKDPTPMDNFMDSHNPDKAWTKDSVQLRIKTDRVIWLTAWFNAKEKRPAFYLEYWKDNADPNKGLDTLVLSGEPDAIDLGQGAQMAFRVDSDGQGYVQEIKIPWKLLYRNPPHPAPGMSFSLGLEFLWGEHRYTDNFMAGQPLDRAFFFMTPKLWGAATLVEQGHVPVRQYVPGNSKLLGTIPIRATVPKAAKKFTLVIENDQGQRIRNLAADLNPEDYTVEKQGDNRLIEVLWDGLDDKGKLVAPGSYKVRGLSQEGLHAVYDMTVYNPGTPPWESRGGGWRLGIQSRKPEGGCCLRRLCEYRVAYGRGHFRDDRLEGRAKAMGRGSRR